MKIATLMTAGIWAQAKWARTKPARKKPARSAARPLFIGGAALVTLGLLGACVDPATHYSKHAARIEATGGLRTEFAPTDAPFDDADLVRNFERIAFFTEYTQRDGVLTQEETASTLSRWDGALKLRLEGGGVRPSDKSSYRRFAKRLSRLTGVNVSVGTATDEDVLVYILNEDERSAFRDALASTKNPDRYQIIDDWTQDIYYPCVALVGYANENRGEISSGIIVIKAELEGVMRESCIHEELTQVMGLMNDHPDVRPSIFNDDEEFALLTKHDELLLRILYDKRLRPAMTLDEARPLIPAIVQDVRSTEN